MNSNISFLTLNGIIWGCILIITSCIAQPQLIHAQITIHNEAILQCDENIKVEKAVLLKTEAQANGTVFEYYDRNGDENTDIIAISHILNAGEHYSYPFMWIVDLDYDNTPDAVYIDMGEKNECKSIKLYKDLRQPHQEEKDQKQEGYTKSFENKGRP